MTTQDYGIPNPLGYYSRHDAGSGDVLFRIYGNDGNYRSSRCVSSSQAEIDEQAYPMIGYRPLAEK